MHQCIHVSNVPTACGGDRPVDLGAGRREEGHLVPALRRQQQGRNVDTRACSFFGVVSCLRSVGKETKASQSDHASCCSCVALYFSCCLRLMGAKTGSAALVSGVFRPREPPAPVSFAHGEVILLYGHSTVSSSSEHCPESCCLVCCCHWKARRGDERQNSRKAGVARVAGVQLS